MENKTIRSYVIKDPHGKVVKEGGLSVVSDVHVTLEPGIGEPYAMSEYVDGELYITLYNLQGNGISTIEYEPSSVDAGINIIRIIPLKGEPYEFEVRNGSKGDKGDKGNKGDKGDKGDPGDSVIVGEGDLPLANVVSGATDKAITPKGVQDALHKQAVVKPDFALVDPLFNCLMVLNDGHVKTKKFDSAKVADSLDFDVQDSDKAGFAIQDANRKVVAIFKEGHLITKYFDSRNLGRWNPWKGKNICVIGDSLTELNWFAKVMGDELECNIYNRGWSGVPVTPMITLGSGNNKTYAFTRRFDLPDNNGLGNGDLSVEHSGTPSTEIVDLIIIFGGTNDWGHGYIGETSSSYTPIRLGSFEDAMSDIANGPNVQNGASFYAALKYTCFKAKQKYPNVPLAICTLLPSCGYNDGTNRSSEYVVESDMSVTLKEKTFLDGKKSKADFNEAIRKVAKQFGAYVIDLDKMLGFPDFSEEMAELYYNNGDMTHPSQNYGAVVLGKFIAQYIKNNIIFMDKNI